MDLLKLATYVDGYLKVTDIKDYPNAVNGLQLENTGIITKIAAAVDACEITLQRAAESGANLLLVHHGLFWGGLAPISGVAYRKIRLAMENDLAVYSAHLPLDAHPVLGNNALLCDALEFAKERTPFMGHGWQVEEDISREVLLNRLEQAVGGGRVHLAAGGPIVSKRIGVVTGGAGGEIARAAAEGVDTFITGEGPHWSYTAAEELGVNLFYAGHYATETFGVRALAQHLAERFSLEWEFIDHPTGL